MEIRAKKSIVLDNYDAVKEKALRLLEFRSHSEFELKEKLNHFGAKSEDIEKTFEFLHEYHLTDDRIYASRLANDLSHIKKFGKHRIKAELARRGIGRDIISDVLEEIETDEGEQLLPLMEKKLSGDFDRKNRDRAFRYFAARGYSFDDIKRAFDEISSEAYDD
ncbi:MAG: regulatory protein RecX [Eubacteriales bacterium]|nr:regulatory protein RecX [Eubacteriales bacterium]